MGDVHIDISNDDNPRFALYAGGVFELMVGSFSINMNADQFQQLCDNLRPWIVDDSARPAAVSEELLAAASAVVARWDSPLWKDQPHTGELIQRLRNALAEQAPPAAVPAGYVLVPVEPTEAMRDAFLAELWSATYFTNTTLQCADFDSRYRAMLAAANKENTNG